MCAYSKLSFLGVEVEVEICQTMTQSLRIYVLTAEVKVTVKWFHFGYTAAPLTSAAA